MTNEEGIKSDPEKVEPVGDMDTPQNLSDVRHFLGMGSQLGRFILHLAEKAKPLRDVSKKTEFLCEQAHTESFEKLKDELNSTPVLAHYDPLSGRIIWPWSSTCTRTRQQRIEAFSLRIEIHDQY